MKILQQNISHAIALFKSSSANLNARTKTRKMKNTQIIIIGEIPNGEKTLSKETRNSVSTSRSIPKGIATKIDPRPENAYRNFLKKSCSFSYSSSDTTPFISTTAFWIKEKKNTAIAKEPI